MIPSELLSILCCPETHQSLRLAEPAEVGQVNQRIAAGLVKNRAGQVVAEKIEAGLIRADGQFLYPVRQNIPILLVDEALPMG